MDRPAGRERRRRAVPLGLHADGRPRGRARRDAARAAPRRAGGAGRVGRDRAQPVGGAAGARAARARAARRRRRPDTPGPFALGDAERVRELLEQAGFADVARRGARAAAPPRRLRGVLGVDARPVARLPRRRARRDRKARSRRSRRVQARRAQTRRRLDSARTLDGERWRRTGHRADLRRSPRERIGCVAVRARARRPGDAADPIACAVQ